MSNKNFMIFFNVLFVLLFLSLSRIGTQKENRNGNKKFSAYHGKSWMHCLANPDEPHHETIFASHTFHEIQMYYPMRVIRDTKFKLIWNRASCGVS